MNIEMKKTYFFIFLIIAQNCFSALSDDKFEQALDIAQAATCVAYKKSKTPVYRQIYNALKNQREKMHNNEGPLAKKMCHQEGEVVFAYTYSNTLDWYLCNNSSDDSLMQLAQTAIHETSHIIKIDRSSDQKIDECRVRDHELSILSLATGFYEDYKYLNKDCAKLTHEGNSDLVDDESMIDFLEDNKSCKIKGGLRFPLFPLPLIPPVF